MNRKGIVESNEKQEAVMKDNPVKNIHLAYKCFSESSFSLSKMEAVEAQRRRYKGYQILGAKIVSEKKKEAQEKHFVSVVGQTSALVH